MVLITAQGIREPLLFSPRGIAYGITESGPFLFRGHGDCDPFIVALAGIDAVGGHGGMPIASARLQPPVHGIVHNGSPHKVGDGLHLGEIDVLSLPCPAAVL